MPNDWTLDPDIVFLNHGSFGACPTPVLEEQARLREALEAEPVRFFVREVPELLEAARREVSAFLGANPENLVFIPNATSGINAVLQSLDLQAGDEVLVTDHEYNACRNVVDYVTDRAGARAVVVPIPFPIESSDRIVEILDAAVTDRTRVLLVDHITSQTALVFPVAAIVDSMRSKGVEVLVDGAHGPGMVPLDLEKLGASWYAGNCHKWVCAPKGAGILWSRSDLRDDVRPAVISHGANAPVTDRSRYHMEFDWVGTLDPTPWLSVPAAIRFLGGLVDGGWPGLMERNRQLAVEARKILCDQLEIAPPCPDDMLGSMASLPLPDGDPQLAPGPFDTDPLQDRLLEEHAIEVPVFPWPAWPGRFLRVSAQFYNAREDYVALAAALGAIGRS